MSQEAIGVIQSTDNTASQINSCLTFVSSGDVLPCKIRRTDVFLSYIGQSSFPSFLGVIGSASDFLQAEKYLLGVKLHLKLTRGVCIEWAWYWPPAGCSVYPAYLQWGHLVCASALLPRAALDAWVYCAALGIWHMVEMSGQGSISAREESLGR